RTLPLCPFAGHIIPIADIAPFCVNRPQAIAVLIEENAGQQMEVGAIGVGSPCRSSRMRRATCKPMLPLQKESTEKKGKPPFSMDRVGGRWATMHSGLRTNCTSRSTALARQLDLLTSKRNTVQARLMRISRLTLCASDAGIPRR